jgi:two-component system cell cycle sensor histidine kinase/response regulator CckA
LKKDNDKSLPEDEVMDLEEQQRRSLQEYIFQLEESQDLASELALVQEENLEYTVSLLRATLDSTADGILAVDLKGKIVSHNQRFTDLWGIPEGILAHQDVEQFFAYALKQLKNPAAFQGRVQELYTKREHQSFDWLEFKDGKIFELYSQPQSIDHRIMGRVWSFRDVTDQKRAEEALRQSEEKYRALINLASDGILLTHLDGNLLEINNKMMELLGQPLGQILSMHFSEIFPPGEQEKHRAAFQAITEEGEAEINDTWIKHKDGQHIPVDITGSIVKFDSKTVVQWIFRETTERKKLEEERIKISNLESLGILAGGIAHDFNNILTAIIGNINMAGLEQKEGPGRERLHETEKACMRAQTLARQLLTFARGGAPVKELITVEKLVTESTSFAARGSNVNYEFSFPDNLWAIEADPGQLGQVVQNLVINSIQAMPAGGTIMVRVENLFVKPGNDLPLEEGKYLKISIQDQGIGIPEEYLSKIFDPYFSTKQRGSGLGLATTYSIIKNHHGYIGVESKLEEGTNFYFYLPATEQEITEPLLNERQILKGQGKILVMDDDVMVRDMLSGMLQNLGYEAHCAENGEEAIKLYIAALDVNQPFTAVILDLTVPGGMGGKEAIGKLLKIDPQVKAIVSSGYSEDPIMAEFVTYGFSGVIAKPYRVLEVSNLLNTLIDKD